MFGEKLKQARKNKGIRQLELAKLLNTTNTSVSNWENNFSRPDLDMIKKMCSILDVSANYFLEIDEEELSSEEKNIINLYRIMDEQGKEVLSYILKQEEKRIRVYNELQQSIKEMKEKLNETDEYLSLPMVARSKDADNKVLKINKNINLNNIKGIQGDEF